MHDGGEWSYRVGLLAWLAIVVVAGVVIFVNARGGAVGP